MRHQTKVNTLAYECAVSTMEDLVGVKRKNKYRPKLSFTRSLQIPLSLVLERKKIIQNNRAKSTFLLFHVSPEFSTVLFIPFDYFSLFQ